MLRGGRQGKNEQEGQWERGAREANERRVRASPAYDSDSYENHVIDLQGDSYEEDKYGSIAEARSAGPDRELESSQDRQQLSLADSRHDHVTPDGQPANGKSAGYDSRVSGDLGRSGMGSNSEVPCTGGETSQNGQFVGGEVVWAKFARFPWWPAQVQDERDLNEDFKGDKPAAHNIAVRFFGTYDYAWVDPTVGLSRFDVKLHERSRTRKRALTKGVEEAVEFRATGKLPQNWDGTASESEQSSHRAETNGVKVSKDESVQANSQTEEPEQRRAARTRKPKVLFEVCHTASARKNGAKVKERSLKQEDIGHRRPERKLRRIRIMRYLGLAAPYGSPFASDIGSRM